MAYLLQFCGFSNPLQLFYLEQRTDCATGPVFAGFRPFQLDDLLIWALDSARCRRWDGDAIQHTVLDAWMDRADLIRQWQLRLRHEPADTLLVAGLGTPRDWERRCESLLQV